MTPNVKSKNIFLSWCNFCISLTGKNVDIHTQTKQQICEKGVEVDLTPTNISHDIFTKKMVNEKVDLIPPNILESVYTPTLSYIVIETVKDRELNEVLREYDPL